MKKPIFVLFGEKGVGKNTLIREALKQAPERVGFVPIATAKPRPARNEDGLPYHFVSEKQFPSLFKQQLTSMRDDKYSYLILKDELDALLAEKSGLMIASEETIKRLRKIKGYEIVPIYVEARYRTLPPDEDQRIRKSETIDKPKRMSARRKIINMFREGGKEHAASLLIKFIRGYAM